MARGQPKKFDSADQLVKLWSDFCDYIVRSEFEVVPTQSAFCRWLEKEYKAVDRKTIYNSLNKYFPNIKKDFEQIQSDTIMQGGMLGHYNATMSIFGLKNWCGWGDSGRYSASTGTEQQDDPLTKALKEEAERLNDANIS